MQLTNIVTSCANACGNMSYCTGLIGGPFASCSCITGSYMNGSACASGCLVDSDCGPFATCGVWFGYGCTCNTGYQQQPGDYVCTAVNPCESVPSACGHHSVCIYLGPGQHQCSCLPGFVFTSTLKNDCTLADGCTSITCGPGSVCVASGPRSYTCTCLPGYASNSDPQAGCRLVNICAINNGGCTGNASCMMGAYGGRTCWCHAGYELTGTACTAVNQCSINNGGCGTSLACSMNGTQVGCQCRAGYSLVGTTCQPINACAVDNGGCGADMACTSIGPGRTRCTCSGQMTYNRATNSCGQPVTSASTGSAVGAGIGIGLGVACGCVVLVSVYRWRIRRRAKVGLHSVSQSL